MDSLVFVIGYKAEILGVRRELTELMARGEQE
jgi:hypothetical protein